MDIIYGIITGIIFGFFLQKGQVLRYDKQLGALRLKDFTIIKFMLSTIIVSMIGIYFLRDAGLVKLSIKEASLGANVIGGLIFGIGWALLGYCPATAAGAFGEGRIDAVAGIIGMLAGAALYAEMYPLLKETVLTWGNFGKIALPEIIGIHHWIVIAVITVIFICAMYLFEKRNL